MDGQLEECSLTLRELATLKEVFITRLNTAFHHRIDYPGVDFEGNKKRERSNGNKQSNNGKSRTQKDKEHSPKNIEYDGS